MKNINKMIGFMIVTCFILVGCKSTRHVYIKTYTGPVLDKSELANVRVARQSYDCYRCIEQVNSKTYSKCKTTYDGSTTYRETGETFTLKPGNNQFTIVDHVKLAKNTKITTIDETEHILVPRKKEIWHSTWLENKKEHNLSFVAKKGQDYIIRGACLGELVVHLNYPNDKLGLNKGIEGEINGVVTKFYDGDTIIVRGDDNVDYGVQLAGIDAPEKEQPFGIDAEFALKNYLRKTGNRVIVSYKFVDYARRLHGTVFSGSDKNPSNNINKLMVENGYAWASDRLTLDEYVAIADEAKKKGIGLWHSSNPVPPWEWRKAHREKKMVK